MLTGADVDLARLPIPRHFAEDGGAYITNGIVVAKNPDTGVRNASFHRMQLKGPSLLGTSLHSRRHLWSYARRAQELGQDLPVVVIIGCHPLHELRLGPLERTRSTPTSTRWRAAFSASR